jgi:uncharacterized protein YjbJ (UPF0337 family)
VEPVASEAVYPASLFPIEEMTMGKDHMEGAADKAKGAIGDPAGKPTADMQVPGKRDDAKGAPYQTLAEAQQAARNPKARIDAARSAADYAEANAGDLDEE